MLLKDYLTIEKRTAFITKVIIIVNGGIKQTISANVRESHLMHVSYGIHTSATWLGHEEGRI